MTWLVVLIGTTFSICGYAIQIKSLPIYMIVYSYISSFRFGFQAILSYEFNDRFKQSALSACSLLVNCTNKKDPLCFEHIPGHPLCNPALVFDFIENQYWTNILILVIQGIIFRLSALACLYQFSKDQTIENLALPEDLSRVIRRHKKERTKMLTRIMNRIDQLPEDNFEEFQMPPLD